MKICSPSRSRQEVLHPFRFLFPLKGRGYSSHSGSPSLEGRKRGLVSSPKKNSGGASMAPPPYESQTRFSGLLHHAARRHSARHPAACARALLVRLLCHHAFSGE